MLLYRLTTLVANESGDPPVVEGSTGFGIYVCKANVDISTSAELPQTPVLVTLIVTSPGLMVTLYPLINVDLKIFVLFFFYKIFPGPPPVQSLHVSYITENCP